MGFNHQSYGDMIVDVPDQNDDNDGWWLVGDWNIPFIILGMGIDFQPKNGEKKPELNHPTVGGLVWLSVAGNKCYLADWKTATLRVAHEDFTHKKYGVFSCFVYQKMKFER